MGQRRDANSPSLPVGCLDHLPSHFLTGRDEQVGSLLAVLSVSFKPLSTWLMGYFLSSFNSLLHCKLQRRRASLGPSVSPNWTMTTTTRKQSTTALRKWKETGFHRQWWTKAAQYFSRVFCLFEDFHEHLVYNFIENEVLKNKSCLVFSS